MSRITDYILEPKVVYTEGGFLVRVKVIDDYKYKKYIVSENLHYKTVQGTSFTLTDADTTKQAEITEIKGNTRLQKLPDSYQEVEYIQTTGTQWINTGVAPSNDIRIKTDIEVSQTGQDKAVFGLYVIGTEATSISNAYHLTPYSSKWYYGTNGGQGSAGVYSPVVGTRYNIDFNCDSHGHILINGQNITAYDETYGGGSYSNPIIGISWRGYSAGATRKGQFKYYSFKMLNKNTNQYIRNFIPCYRKSDNVIGMYDTVGKTFYTNAGTGTFNKGNNVNTVTPTPDAPVEVKTVSGDNNVVVSNKNLFDSNYNDYDLSGLYGYIKVTEENTDYVISLIEKDSSISLSGIYFGWTKNGFDASAGLNWVINNGNLVSGPKINKQGQTYLGCISFYPKNETTFNKIISKYDIQIEKGNQVTTYVEHQSNSYRVDLGGKNIFNIEQAITRMENNAGTLVNGWGTYEDGILTMNRSMGYHGTTCFAGQKFNLEANKTYTLSAIVYLTGTNATSNVILGFAGESNPNVTITKEVWTKVSRTVTFTQYKENMRAFIQPSNTGNVLQIKEIMLCEGTDTTFSPYTDNPIELCKIGNYQDKLYYDSGKWYLEKNIKKVVLNGSENWEFVATYTNTSRFKLRNFNDIKQNSTELLVMSNYFQGQTTNNRTLDVIGVAPYSTEIYIRTDTSISTVDAFKTWLGTNNTTLYYVLATPTTEEITDSYLLEQLNNILDIELYEDLCYVDFVGNVKADMTLLYAGTEDLGIKYIITEDGKKIRTDWRKLGRRKKWMMK